jgi:hypothetical protein
MQTVGAPTESIDHVKVLAKDAHKTSVCTHNQGGDRGTDETPAEGVDRVNILAEDACCKTIL